MPPPPSLTFLHRLPSSLSFLQPLSHSQHLLLLSKQVLLAPATQGFILPSPLLHLLTQQLHTHRKQWSSRFEITLVTYTHTHIHVHIRTLQQGIIHTLPPPSTHTPLHTLLHPPHTPSHSPSTLPTPPHTLSLHSPHTPHTLPPLFPHIPHSPSPG